MLDISYYPSFSLAPDKSLSNFSWKGSPLNHSMRWWVLTYHHFQSKNVSPEFLYSFPCVSGPHSLCPLFLKTFVRFVITFTIKAKILLYPFVTQIMHGGLTKVLQQLCTTTLLLNLVPPKWSPVLCLHFLVTFNNLQTWTQTMRILYCYENDTPHLTTLESIFHYVSCQQHYCHQSFPMLVAPDVILYTHFDFVLPIHKSRLFI